MGVAFYRGRRKRERRKVKVEVEECYSGEVMEMPPSNVCRLVTKKKKMYVAYSHAHWKIVLQPTHNYFCLAKSVGTFIFQ